MCIDLAAGDQPQKLCSFMFVKTQIIGSDLGYKTLGTQTGNRQKRILPPDDHQMQGLGKGASVIRLRDRAPWFP